jgi:hypothetical protein
MLLLAGVGAYFGMWTCTTSGYGRKMGMIQGYWGNEWWIKAQMAEWKRAYEPVRDHGKQH